MMKTGVKRGVQRNCPSRRHEGVGTGQFFAGSMTNFRDSLELIDFRRVFFSKS